ncbi:hypothetical protein [Candidatus Hydrogenosomobacter endosymbioticus]|uniref:Porin domain-containing protein n=1 Tax=Candidatus Hydrogenosomobacter endosymbioticus TaxID=2558174 RepID=A0ABN6L4F8_9PROT|nr:hypothetical protein [Candidatus Hydrogenosomobacter endosymbioticus]BDB96492.1 hypothetical protein HYD_6250 [Candidatus Hydrogenosomobacter endosymbioticus]
MFRKFLFLGFALSAVAAADGVGSQAAGKDGGFEVTFSGKFLSDAFFGNQKALGTYSLRKDDSGKVSASYKENKNQHVMFALDNSKVNIEAKSSKDWMDYSFLCSFTGDKNAGYGVREIFGTCGAKSVGLVMFGNTKGVEDRCAVSPVDFAAGSGGVDGNFFRFVNGTSGVWMAPTLIGETGYATKFSAYSERFYGFQLGVSYAPNNQHLGEQGLKTDASPYRDHPVPFCINVWSPGVNYLYKVDGGYFSMSWVAVSGKTKAELANSPMLKRRNTFSHAVGMTCGIGAFEFGVEGIFNGKSQTFSNNMLGISPVVNGTAMQSMGYFANKAGKYWSVDAGVGYTIGSGKLTFTYLHSQRHTGFAKDLASKSVVAKGDAYVLSAEYNVAPGLMPFVEGAVYKMKNKAWAYGAAYRVLAADSSSHSVDAVKGNTAKVVLCGIKVQF